MTSRQLYLTLSPARDLTRTLLTMTKSTDLENLIDIVKTFDNAMLVTRSERGELRSRPMHIVATKPTGSLVFVTSKEDAKVEEVRSAEQVNVTLQDGQRFVSISGTASTDADRKRIGLYYDKAWQIWLPEGINDPNILLIDVAATTAEYWDGSGMNRVKYAISAARALLNEEKIDDAATEHATVRLDS